MLLETVILKLIHPDLTMTRDIEATSDKTEALRLKADNFDAGVIIPSGTTRLVAAPYLLQANDIVFSAMGNSIRVALVLPTTSVPCDFPFTPGTGMLGLRIDPDKADYREVYCHLLANQHKLSHLLLESTFSTRINAKSLRQLDLPLNKLNPSQLEHFMGMLTHTRQLIVSHAKADAILRKLIPALAHKVATLPTDPVLKAA